MGIRRGGGGGGGGGMGTQANMGEKIKMREVSHEMIKKKSEYAMGARCGSGGGRRDEGNVRREASERKRNEDEGQPQNNEDKSEYATGARVILMQAEKVVTAVGYERKEMTEEK